MMLFVRDSCPKCAELAARLQAAGVELDAVPGLTVCDMRTPDGLAEADMHDIWAAPTLLEWQDERNWCCTSDVDEIVGILTTEAQRARRTEGKGDGD